MKYLLALVMMVGLVVEHLKRLPPHQQRAPHLLSQRSG